MNIDSNYAGDLVAGIRAVLIVDDEPEIRHFLRSRFSERGWVCHEADNGRAALALAQTIPEIQLIVTDMAMPEMNGIELLRHLRSVACGTPVIIISGYNEVPLAVSAMRLGAVNYLVKPFVADDLERAVSAAVSHGRLALVAQASLPPEPGITKDLLRIDRGIRRASDSALVALSSSLGAREEQTRRHSIRVSHYAHRLARELDLPYDWQVEITWGALIHDIGKIGIPDSILLKPGPLTPEERGLVQQHTGIGHRLVREIPELKYLDEMVLSHHEHFDGGGYPNGLRGFAISLGARIIAVVDTYDSLTSLRPYRASRSHSAAVEEIQRCSCTQFDPEIVTAFARISQAEIDQSRSFAEEHLTWPDFEQRPSPALPNQDWISFRPRAA